MQAEQISIFVENKAGRLAEVTRILAEADINIRALSLADTTDFGVLRLIVNKTQKAGDVLKENGFTVRRTQVAAVEIIDRPGGLLTVLDLLNGCGINIEYMYAYAHPPGSNAVMIFRFDQMPEALDLLEENGLRILDGKELAGM